MGRFFRDIKKYYKYAIYSGRAGLKAEVANSRLSWLWWILDPLLFMIIYWFLSQILGKEQDIIWSLYLSD